LGAIQEFRGFSSIHRASFDDPSNLLVEVAMVALKKCEILVPPKHLAALAVDPLSKFTLVILVSGLWVDPWVSGPFQIEAKPHLPVIVGSDGFIEVHGAFLSD